jgi:hypothetical protein
MKTSIIKRLFIFLAYNIHNVSAYAFLISLIIVAISNTIYSQVPLLVGYTFWFCLGFYVFSVTYKKANNFLAKKYKENNEYYLNLLEKRKKQVAGKL